MSGLAERAQPRRGLSRALRDPRWLAHVLRGRLSDAVRETRVSWARRSFENGCQRIFASMARDETAETVVLFCHSGFLRFAGLHALLGRRLAQRGALPLFLLAPTPRQPLQHQALRALEGALVRYSRTLYLRSGQPRSDPTLAHAWEVDLPAGVCRALGLELAPALIGGLRRQLKRYLLDFQDPACLAQAAELLRSADATLSICLALRELVRAGRKVRVVATEMLYVPAGIFNIFCRDAGEGMEFVDFGDTYAHYYSGGSLSWQHLGIQNVTRHGLDSHMDVRREDFEAWLASGPDTGEAMREARRVSRLDRTAAAPPPAAVSLLERVAEHRLRGGLVVGIFGHLTFDLAGLTDSGPAHADMADWLNHTIETLAETQHLVLLKPHPEEGRYKGNRKPCQLMSELLRGPLPANVVLLDPLWFNSHALMPHLDAGLVWRSTVAIELTLAGVPVVMAGREAYYRRSLDVLAPRDRSHYRELLLDLRSLRVNAAERERVALLLRYIPEQTFLHLPYVQSAWAAGRGPEAWDQAALRRVLKEGDPALDRGCDVLMA